MFVVLGILLFDAGSIAINYFTLTATGEDIANEVSAGTFGKDAAFFNQFEYKEEAKQLAKEAGVRLVRFDIERDGAVRLTVRRKAKTLVLHYISALDNWIRPTADVEIAPPR